MSEESGGSKAPKPQPPGKVLDLKFLPNSMEPTGDRTGKYPLLQQ
jgi:hypothetical protein